MSSTKHGHADIVSYLASSDSEMLQRLYTDEFTSLTVFRSLRGLAKQYVMNLVLLDNAVWEEVVDKWTLDTSNSHHKAAMYKLKKYKILQSQLQDKQVPQSQNKHQLQQRRPKTKKENIYWLNADFKRCLRNVLLSNATNQIQDIHIDISSLSANAQSKLQSSESIIVFGDTKWDNVLRTIGNVEELEPQAITNRDHLSPLQTLLENVKLLKIDRHDGNILKVTPEGFKFLFQDIHTQIWQMIVAYLDTCESRKLSKLDIIKFLFKLSFLTPGKVYSRENLTKDVIVLIDDLIHFGLVWGKSIRGRDISQREIFRVFQPTHLAKYLSSGQSLTKSERDSQGFIIVESTFKLYAYTSSDLQISLLRKFIRLEYKMPNFVSGKITKNSIKNAIEQGIPMDLIIDYLTKYAHPLMRKKYPIIPINVVDQMRLWESENKRLKITRATMINMIETDEQFDRYCTVVNSRENDERSQLLADSNAPQTIEHLIQCIDTFLNEKGLFKSQMDREQDEVEKRKQRLLKEKFKGMGNAFANRLNQSLAMGNGFGDGLDAKEEEEIILRDKVETLIDFYKGELKQFIVDMCDLQKEDMFLYKRYLMIFKKYGWNEKDKKWQRSHLQVIRQINRNNSSSNKNNKDSGSVRTNGLGGNNNNNNDEMKDPDEVDNITLLNEAFDGLLNDLMTLSDELCSIHLTDEEMQRVSSKLLWSNKAEKTMILSQMGTSKLKAYRGEEKAKLLASGVDIDMNMGPSNSNNNMNNNINSSSIHSSHNTNNMMSSNSSSGMSSMNSMRRQSRMNNNNSNNRPGSGRYNNGYGNRPGSANGRNGNMRGMNGMNRQQRPQSGGMRGFAGIKNNSRRPMMRTGAQAIQISQSRHKGGRRAGNDETMSSARQMHYARVNQQKMREAKYQSRD